MRWRVWKVGDRRIRRWFAWYPVLVYGDRRRDWHWLGFVYRFEIRGPAGWSCHTIDGDVPSGRSQVGFLHDGPILDSPDYPAWAAWAEAEAAAIDAGSTGPGSESPGPYILATCSTRTGRP